MDAALQGVELDVAVRVADHQLAVEHVAPWRELELREVAAEGLAAAGLDVGVGPVGEDDRAEAVELLLVCPLLAHREGFARQRKLWLDRRCEREGQPDPTVCRRARASRGSGIGTAASKVFVYGS